MHGADLESLINKNRNLFWSVNREDLKNLSLDSVVEHFLNYGYLAAIKELFGLIGIEEAARIFYGQIKMKRVNYHRRTINFFELYFIRNAPGNFIN
jgi:hypothetical protein